MKANDKEKSYLIHLISAAINEKMADKPPENLNWDLLYKMACFHSVSNIIYYSTRELEDAYKPPQDILEKIYSDYKKSMGREATQHIMVEMLLEKFEENQIECIPLKGYIIKYLYPSTDMRTMGDVDILYKDEKTLLVREVMKNMGYTLENKGDKHEKYYKKPCITIEMHKNLIDSMEPYKSYYKNIWDKAVKREQSEFIYKFSKEDYYIYLIVHYTIHFAKFGAGIRNIIDIFIYNKHYKNEMDWGYIESQLSKLNILEFERNSRVLANMWFSQELRNTENDKFYIEIGEYILDSGVYGTVKNGELLSLIGEDENELNLKKTKHIYGLMLIFPPLEKMKKRFKVLSVLPVLLPIFWVIRIIRCCFYRKDISIKKLETIYSAKEIDIKKIKDLYKRAGLFN